MTPQDVRKGDVLYIPSAYYIDHGEDDRCGGIAIVQDIRFDSSVSEDNAYMARFERIDSWLNLAVILSQQERLKDQYTDHVAHQCPDVPGHICPNPRLSHLGKEASIKDANNS